MRLCLVASKPTDAVTYGFLPAAERLGLEVFLLTDQPEAHVGALTRAAVVTAEWPAGTGPAGERALAGPVPGIAGRAQLCTPKDVLARRVTVKRLRAGDVVAFGLAGAYAWNISHHDFLMHPPPGFHYLT